MDRLDFSLQSTPWYYSFLQRTLGNPHNCHLLPHDIVAFWGSFSNPHSDHLLPYGIFPDRVVGKPSVMVHV